MISPHLTAVSCSNRATTFRSPPPSVAAVVVVVAVARTVPPTDDEERPRCETWKALAVADDDCCDGDGAATDDEA